MDTLEETRLEDTEETRLQDMVSDRDEAELSLVERAERIFRYGNGPERDNPASAEASAYPDGYVRRSPPQPYRTQEGYYRALALKAALYAVGGVLLLILLLALFRNGIMRF